MTTIAFRDGIMAADSLCTSDGVLSHATKLFKRKGDIIGVAGDYCGACRYLKHYGKIECDALDGDFDILIWDGRYLWEDDKSRDPIQIDHQPFYAIGSGAAAAMGAFHMGASAKEAVAAAIKVDIYTNGRIQTKSK